MKQIHREIIIAVVFLVIGIFFTINMPRRGVMYNCDIAEISPDIPIEVKQECRRLRMENKDENRT
jgi:hypothetical protein